MRYTHSRETKQIPALTRIGLFGLLELPLTQHILDMYQTVKRRLDQHGQGVGPQRRASILRLVQTQRRG